jgi:hypothetical protein
MNNTAADDLEIVGFNGRPAVACGRALPVGRRETDGMYCVLHLRKDGGSPAWYGAEEADGYRANGQWTMFASPLFVPGSCRDETRQRLVRQPMVVYADEGMLDTADRLPRPPLPSGEYLIWRNLAGHADSIQAACGSDETIEKLLDNWGAALIERFDAMYRLGREPDYLKRIADFGLCAAKNRPLRWKCYLRYATAQATQAPDHVRRTFDTFTHREFPDVPWQDFIDQLSSLCDVLGAVPARPVPATPTRSQPATALPKVHDITAVKPIQINKLPAL